MIFRTSIRLISRSLVSVLCVFGLLACLGVKPALADVFRYQDSAGKMHYVTSIKDVPEQYQEQVKKPHELPEVSKVKNLNPHQLRPRTKKSYARARNKDVEVFVTSWCGYCKKLEQFLDKKRVRYKRYDIETSAVGKKKHASLGGGGVPVTKIGSKVIRGFNQAALSNALAKR